VDPFITKEWLLAFYAHIGTRLVLLTMDNFEPHIAGLQFAPPPSNIRIQFLPANSTSQFQPLNQGTIQNMKIYYRRQWLRFMLDIFEKQMNLLEYVTVLYAIRWSLRAWNHDILSTTIRNCFYKSTLIEKPLQLPIQQPDILPLFMKVQQAGNITDAMNIANFLNPMDESLSPEEEDMNQLPADQLLQHIIHNTVIPSVEEAEEEENTIVEERVPTLIESLQALRLCMTFLERQEETTPTMIRMLERL
jgi:hypothetical protein